MAGLPAATASAGMYTVWSCRGPAGEPLPAHAWTFSGDALTTDAAMTDGCATGGSLELALTEGIELVHPVHGLATLAAPPGAPIVDFTLWRSIERAPPGTYAFGATTRTKVHESASVDEGCSASTGPCETLGDPNTPLAPENEVKGIPIAIEAVQLRVACETAPCSAPPGVAARVRLFRASVLIDDLSAPSAPQLSGSLAGAAPVVGPAVLVVESTDLGGGIAKTTLSIDGGPPQTKLSSGQGGSCQEPYTLPQPCPAGAAHVFVVDTAALPAGPHTASGTVVDAGGNETAFGPIAFTVEHLPPPPQGDSSDLPDNGTPPVRRPLLRFDRNRVEHRAGRPGRLTGTLVTRGGTPIAGARLTVSARGIDSVASRVRRLAPVSTSATGRFAIVLPGDGARDVSVSFAPRDDALPTVTRTATVLAHARLTISRSRARVARGQPVTLGGRLLGAAATAAGAVVEIQAIVDKRWQTVATVPTRRGGHYRWPYRFRYVTRDAIFSFRAIVRRTPGWPWPTLRSPRIEVRVDGAPGAAARPAGDRSARPSGRR